MLVEATYVNMKGFCGPDIPPPYVVEPYCEVEDLLIPVVVPPYDPIPEDDELEILEVTNAEKLALTGIEAGQQVSVSDGFISVGRGYYAPFPGRGSIASTINGKLVWFEARGDNAGNVFFAYSGTEWQNVDNENGEYIVLVDPANAVAGNESYPWEADWTIHDYTLTCPAAQQLTSPSILSGGVFVSEADGASAELNGVYEKGGDYSSGGKNDWLLKGSGDINASSLVIKWTLDDEIGWRIYSSSGAILYSSTEDVATPDLVTTWTGADHAIIVTALTSGQMVAGTKIETTIYAALANTAVVSIPEGLNGRIIYRDVAHVAPDLTWDGTQWDDGDGHTSSTNTAFPWDATWVGVTVTRDDVASEANWETVE